MARLASSLDVRVPLDEALRRLTAAAVDAVPRVDYASVTVRHPGGGLETRAPTDPLVAELEEIQYDLRSGPCYDAAVGDDNYLVSFDLEHDPRWPQYGPRAAERGIRAQLSVQLADDDHHRAALNLYARRPHAFDHVNIEVAELFASHAALVMGFAQTMEHVSQLVDSRQVIGQAIGIVMERYQLDEERAFSFLTRTSQQSNVKLRAVAADIVAGMNRRNMLRPDQPPQNQT
jgi:GAF domain-containing protein